MSDVEHTSPESFGQLSRSMFHDDVSPTASAMNFAQAQLEQHMLATARTYCRGVLSGLELSWEATEAGRYRSSCTEGLGVSSGAAGQSPHFIPVNETISVEFDQDDHGKLILLKTELRREGAVYSEEDSSTRYDAYHLVEPTLEIISESARTSRDAVVLGRVNYPSSASSASIDTSSQYRERAFPLWYPIGTILSYGGDDWHNDKSIPGWYLCDGTNGMPNLIDKFLKGGTMPGGEGGLNEYSLTVDQLPEHNHDATCSAAGSHSHSYTSRTHRCRAHKGGSLNYWDNVWQNTQSVHTSSSGSHVHSISIGDTGEGTVIDNQPRFYTVRYIMRRS